MIGVDIDGWGNQEERQHGECSKNVKPEHHHGNSSKLSQNQQEQWHQQHHEWGCISRVGLEITIDVVLLVVGNTIGSAVIKSDIVCVHMKLKSMKWGCRVLNSLCSETCRICRRKSC